MAKIRHFGKMLKLFGNCVTVLLVLGKNLGPSAAKFSDNWPNFYHRKWPNIENII